MLSDNLEAVMTETKNGLWSMQSLEERPFNVFVVQERCESIHTVRKSIYIGHKLPRTFDCIISIYDTNAHKKSLEKLLWTK